jgi:choline dehydrogenase-like flavoprotein
MAAQKQDFPAHVGLENFLAAEHDYLIVGAGTAGLVLAARLSENPKINVGVIEAGKLRVDDENVNGLAGGPQMWHNPEYDWMFKTVPQVRMSLFPRS